MKRSIRRPRPKTGDSWQTIYMDLMTIIMVFFVILWSLNQGKDDGVSDTVGDVTTRIINLPGDVLFAPGKTKMSGEGSGIFNKLFKDDASTLDMKTNGLVKRMLFIHGHTDSQGSKEKNLQLGFTRAYSAYREILQYNKNLKDHVVICSHADNTPVNEVPKFKGKLKDYQKVALREAHKKNRRITIEDRLVNQFKGEE